MRHRRSLGGGVLQAYDDRAAAFSVTTTASGSPSPSRHHRTLVPAAKTGLVVPPAIGDRNSCPLMSLRRPSILAAVRPLDRQPEDRHARPQVLAGRLPLAPG